MELVESHIENHIAQITLNSPDSRNALSGEMVDQLVDAITDAGRNGHVHCLLLSAKGASFCSGGDLREIRDLTDGDPLDQRALELWYEEGVQKVPLALNALQIPTVAAIQGHAIGAGCDLALFCDIRIAGESALFAESFLRVGLIPGDGGAWALPRVVGYAKAAEMLFTGDGVGAQEAERIGLVSRVVPDSDLPTTALSVARKISAQPPSALREAKALLRMSEISSLQDCLMAAARVQARIQRLPEHKEAVAAILEKRKASFAS